MNVPASITSGARRAASEAQAIGRTHPIRRGGFAAIVFSGHRDAMGELAGEATAHTPRKFVCVDPNLREDQDFAQTSGATLPSWPSAITEPVAGVCFVFSSSQHPAARRLAGAGAKLGEDFEITSGLVSDGEDDLLPERIASLLCAVPPQARFAILGFGRQGQRIAEHLTKDFAVEASRILVWDSSPQSAAIAAAVGYRVVESEAEVCRCDAVLASPLARYAKIDDLLEKARRAGAVVFNNAQRSSGLSMWRHDGGVWLDEAAHRALQVRSGTVIECRSAEVRPLVSVHVIREDVRVLGPSRIPHLHSGQSHAMVGPASPDVAQRWHGDDLAECTWDGLNRAFVSLRTRADLGFFAARELCRGLWPQATQRIFPSEHAIDLGATTFERLLLNHLDNREIVSTMQTPAQRVTLGIVAAHYASDRPMIEIGSALGGSALHLAAATARASDAEGTGPTIHSIDPDAPTRDIMRFALQREGFGDRIEQHLATSDNAIGRLRYLRDACGLVFIDGLHCAEAVRNDFMNYAALVAIDGALAFHDVCPALHSVMQAVMAHVLVDDRFEARCLVDGLLILERVR